MRMTAAGRQTCTVRRLAALSAGASVALVVLSVVVARWPGLPIDVAASAAARRFGLRHAAWVQSWRVVTHAGDSLPLLLAGIALITVLVARHRYREAWLVGVAGAATHLVALAVRYGVDRPRPVDGFTTVASPAYPSGHTVHSATAAVLAVHLLWPHLPRRGVLVAAAAAAAVTTAAVAVGVSRVVLRAHWPTDVLGGWLLVAAVWPLVLIAAEAWWPSAGSPPADAGVSRPSARREADGGVAGLPE